MQRGKALELLKELTKLKAESDDVDIDMGPEGTIKGRFSSFPATWYLWLYKRYLCQHRSVDDAIKQLELQYEALSQEVADLSKQEHQSTGNAIIIFNWVPDAANMLYDHNLRNTPANLFVPSFIGRSSNIVTKGKFAKTPKMRLPPPVGDGQQGESHRHVSVTRAPEPSDFMWNNTLYGGWPIIRRRIIAWVGCLTLYAVRAVAVSHIGVVTGCVCCRRSMLLFWWPPSLCSCSSQWQNRMVS